MRGEEQCDLPDEQAEEKIKKGNLHPLYTGDRIYVSGIMKQSIYPFISEKAGRIRAGFYIALK